MNRARRAVRGAPLRIAAIAALVFAAAYAVVATGAVLTVRSEGVANVDANLYLVEQQVLFNIDQPNGSIELEFPPGTVGWVGDGGHIVEASRRAPASSPPQLPTGSVETRSIAGASYRLLRFDVHAQVAPGTPISWMVIGESLSGVDARTEQLTLATLAVAPVVLAVVFLLAWWIGRSAAAPAIRARERELAFTADASHELRTPLQVIEAESSLALLRERPAEAYRGTIERISGESRRLRTIVDDLLWLARIEEMAPRADQRVPVDLAAIVRTTEERFLSVAGQRGIVLAGHADGAGGPSFVLASVEWLERLAGVLVDNAIRYTPDGGRIDLWSVVRGGRVVLGVADSGPGVTTEQSQHIFERFHRASATPGGAGLGLAIADSIVRATGGQWSVGRSTQLGGAQFEVSWPAQRAPRHLESPAEPAAQH